LEYYLKHKNINFNFHPNLRIVSVASYLRPFKLLSGIVLLFKDQFFLFLKHLVTSSTIAHNHKISIKLFEVIRLVTEGHYRFEPDKTP